MGDIFSSSDACDLLRNKFVVILGDSNFRSMYKDLLILLQETKFMPTDSCKAKGEHRFMGDTLLEGGRKGDMHNGISYREKRIYQSDSHKIQYEFITRAYNSHVEGILKRFSSRLEVPDVLILHSALWDMSRYGHRAADEYKENVDKLFRRAKSLLPPETLVIWATGPPISNSPRGGVLVPEVDFLKDTLRLDVMCGNAFAAKCAQKHGFDLVDLHFFMHQQIHRRVKDGIHWDNTALRRMVNILLTHIAEAWGTPLPSRVSFDGTPRVSPQITPASTHSNSSVDNRQTSLLPKKSETVGTVKKSSSHSRSRTQASSSSSSRPARPPSRASHHSRYNPYPTPHLQPYPSHYFSPYSPYHNFFNRQDLFSGGPIAQHPFLYHYGGGDDLGSFGGYRPPQGSKKRSRTK